MRELITPQIIRETARWSQSDEDMRDTLRQAAAALEYALSGKPVDESGSSAGFFISAETPAPAPHLRGDELLTTIKEFARWHHLNELTISRGGKPSDSEIDFEAIAWNRITRALTTEGQPDA